MDKNLSHRHPDPARGVGNTTGMPGAGRPQTSQQPGKYVSGGDRVVNLLRGWCRTPIAQHGESMLGASGNLNRVQQQRISDVSDRPRSCPLGRRSTGSRCSARRAT